MASGHVLSLEERVRQRLFHAWEQARKRDHITQQQLADRMTDYLVGTGERWTQSRVSHLLRGRRRITVRALDAALAALDLRVADVMDVRPTRAELSRDEERIVEQLRLRGPTATASLRALLEPPQLARVVDGSSSPRGRF